MFFLSNHLQIWWQIKLTITDFKIDSIKSTTLLTSFALNKASYRIYATFNIIYYCIYNFFIFRNIVKKIFISIFSMFVEKCILVFFLNQIDIRNEKVCNFCFFLHRLTRVWWVVTNKRVSGQTPCLRKFKSLADCLSLITSKLTYLFLIGRTDRSLKIIQQLSVNKESDIISMWLIFFKLPDIYQTKKKTVFFIEVCFFFTENFVRDKISWFESFWLRKVFIALDSCQNSLEHKINRFKYY